MTSPPAATISWPPTRPSWPMPVRTTASTSAPHTRAALRKRTSAAGLQEFSGGPSSSWIGGPPGLTGDGPCGHRRGPRTGGRAARARPGSASTTVMRAARVEPLGEQAGEGRRHVLHQKHRHGEVGRQLGHQLGQGIGAAGGRRDHQNRHTGPPARRGGWPASRRSRARGPRGSRPARRRTARAGDGAGGHRAGRMIRPRRPARWTAGGLGKPGAPGRLDPALGPEPARHRMGRVRRRTGRERGRGR